MRTRSLVHLIVLAITTVFVSCGDDTAGKQQAGAGQAMPYPVISLPVKDVTGHKSYPVSIEGIINSGVRAKVQGYIQEVLVDEGAHVKKGQPLFKLETQSLSQDAAAAQASVNAAQVEVNKLKPLVAKGIIGEVQLETAKAQLEQAKSTYNSITANIGYATVKSPVDGFVGAIPYRQGALVGPSDQTPLTTVTDIKQVYAYFSMNETEYLDFLNKTEGASLSEKIKNFPEVSLVLANGATYEQKGTIETVTGQVDRNTGTVSFRAVFDNPAQLLTNGNSGTLLIPVVYKNKVVVPKSATFEQQGQVIVFKAQDGKANTAVINVTDEVNGLYIVANGVTKGEKIVGTGVGKLRNGTPITPQEIPFDSIAKPTEKVFR